jgi:hypothetical protein
MTRVTEAAALPRTDKNGHPWTEYVRVVEFVDGTPVAPDAPPCHGTSHVLFNGAVAPCRLRTDSVTVDLGKREGTVVTLLAHRDDVQIGHNEGDTYVPHLLGGMHVLTPVEEGWKWEPEDPEDTSNPWTVVSFYVAEVHAR